MNKLVVIGIVLIPIILVGLGANMMSDHANEREQRLDQSNLASTKSERFEPIVLQCLTELYNCDINNKYFEGCINGKIDGITIEESCTNSNIKIDDGCFSVEFDDGTKMVTCN